MIKEGFILNDRYEDEHHYEIEFFNANDGFKILDWLMSDVEEAMRGARKTTNADLSEILQKEMKGSSDIKEIVMGIFKAVGGIFGILAKRLESGHMLKLLQNTTRDDIQLNDQHVFDDAFSGNLGELAGLLTIVIERNFTPLFCQKELIKIFKKLFEKASEMGEE